MGALIQVEQVVDDVIVIGLEEFEGLGDAGHRAGRSFYYGGQLRQGQLGILLLAVDESVHQDADALQQLLIFEALR